MPVGPAANSIPTDKDIWTGTERLRWAKYFSVPIMDGIPEGFPVFTLGVQRALAALSQKAPEKFIPCVEGLYRALWVDNQANVGRPEGFAPVLAKVLGKEGAEELVKAVRQSFPQSVYFWLPILTQTIRPTSQTSSRSCWRIRSGHSSPARSVCRGLNVPTPRVRRRGSGVWTIWAWLRISLSWTVSWTRDSELLCEGEREKWDSMPCAMLRLQSRRVEESMNN